MWICFQMELKVNDVEIEEGTTMLYSLMSPFVESKQALGIILEQVLTHKLFLAGLVNSYNLFQELYLI